MEKVRIHYRFYGYVQGVGFRWRASKLASMYGVTGWVRNCFDGSVEMEAEGTEAGINRVVSCLENDLHISIERTEQKKIPLQGGNYFEIK